MAEYEPLNREKHERLRMGATQTHNRFRETTLVPIIIDEIAKVAREYPIIFPDNATGLPCALTGMKPDTNAYVDADGRWLADYIPMHVRQYPFALSKVPNAQQQDCDKQFRLCIDPTAEEFRDLEGVRVFDNNGELTPEASAKGDIARKLMERSGITKALVRVLDEAGLLAERSIKMKLFNGETHVVQGFKVVDEKLLNAIPDEEFVALRNKGAMPLIYAQLMSMANLSQGVLAGQITPKSADADKPEKKKPGEIDLDMFIDDSGDLDIFH